MAARLQIDALAKRLAEIASRSDGRVGIGVRDLVTGESVLVGGDRRYPMQSVFKVPVALAVLDAIEKGRLAFPQRVRVSRDDISVGWSPLGDGIRAHGPRELPLETLLGEMVSSSDNTACDVLLRLIGGPATVQRLLDQHGFKGVRVDRNERDLQTQALGLSWNPALLEKDELQRQGEARPIPVQMKALQAYLADPRDTATPEGVLDLLQALHQGKLLSEASRKFLHEAMLGSTTGPNRLKAGLPPGWRLAHKTGAAGIVAGIQAATNDVGIAHGPNGEAVALVVFVSASAQSQEQREELAAEVARAAVAALR